MLIVEKLRQFLEQEKVPYSVHSHPEAYTALEIAALEHVKGRMLAKVVVAKTSDDALVILVVPADRRVDFRKVAAALRARDIPLRPEGELRDEVPAWAGAAPAPFGI